MTSLQKQLDAAARTWVALVDILGVPQTTPTDDVLSLVLRLAADRTPETTQLLWDAVPEEIPEPSWIAASRWRCGTCTTHSAAIPRRRS